MRRAAAPPPPCAARRRSWGSRRWASSRPRAGPSARASRRPPKRHRRAPARPLRRPHGTAARCRRRSRSAARPGRATAGSAKRDARRHQRRGRSTPDRPFGCPPPPSAPSAGRCPEAGGRRPRSRRRRDRRPAQPPCSSRRSRWLRPPQHACATATRVSRVSPQTPIKERSMAELTTLEEKLAEVIGLAQAAQDATKKVEGLVEDDDVAGVLQRMREEAEETERRCTQLADERDGKKTAILDKARETKGEATEMMKTYLGDDADGLDGFEFLVMAEAGEVGHWAVLGKLNESAGEQQLGELVSWALPIQERHFSDAKECSLKLAGEEDPYEES